MILYDEKLSKVKSELQQVILEFGLFEQKLPFNRKNPPAETGSVRNSWG